MRNRTMRRARMSSSHRLSDPWAGWSGALDKRWATSPPSRDVFTVHLDKHCRHEMPWPGALGRAHNPEVTGSNPVPATIEVPPSGGPSGYLLGERAPGRDRSSPRLSLSLLARNPGKEAVPKSRGLGVILDLVVEGRSADTEREAGVGGIPASSLARTALRTRRAVRP
jgi:hypothetical protein